MIYSYFWYINRLINLCQSQLKVIHYIFVIFSKDFFSSDWFPFSKMLRIHSDCTTMFKNLQPIFQQLWTKYGYMPFIKIFLLQLTFQFSPYTIKDKRRTFYISTVWKHQNNNALKYSESIKQRQLFKVILSKSFRKCHHFVRP